MTAFIKLSTLEYPRFPGDIAIDPMGQDDYTEVVWIDPPVVDTATQTYFEIAPIQIDGVWTMQWSSRDLTPEEIDARTPKIMKNSEPPNVL